MKKIIGIVIFNIVLNYLMFVFVIGSFNPYLWQAHTRAFLIYTTITTIIISMAFHKHKTD